MARPKKQTVDYFPHMCISGKTIFILEQEYQNDGYAFWFKLLEEIGKTPGHTINYNDVSVQRFIAAKTRVSVTKTHEILDLLSELDAIDKELWETGLIWCQNFVNNIYENGGLRRSEIPQKPSLTCNNPIIDELLQQKPQESGVIEESMPQRKGKEIKGKEINTDTIVSVDEPTKKPDPPLKKKTASLDLGFKDETATEAWYESEIVSKLHESDENDAQRKIAEYIREKKPAFPRPYMHLWNLVAKRAGLRGIDDVTNGRMPKFKARIKEPAFDFLEVLRAIKKIPNYRGENKSGWKVTWDYIFKNDTNYLSIIEENRSFQN